jgi:signal transduction histidine kinase
MSLRQGRVAHLKQEDGGIELSCEVDRYGIRRVFHNILHNALDACSDPVEICARFSETEIGGRPALRISLQDNGPGLDAETRRRIFDSFFTTKTHGTGLGMAIVQRLVEAHGGDVSVGDDVGQGAEIVVTLPRSQS